MSSSQTGLSALRAAYIPVPMLLTELKKTKSISEKDLKPIRALTGALSRIVSDESFPQLGRIRRDWYRICSALVTPPLEITDKISKRVERIATHLFENPGKPHEKAVAESIQDLFSDEKVQDTFAKYLASPRGLAAAAKGFVSRIMQGHYGSKFKESILDVSPANPLMLHVNFPRLLLLDLILQKKNPKREVEWFSQAKDEDVQQLLTLFDNFKTTMRTQAGVSESEFPIGVLSRKPRFSKAIESSIAKLLSDVSYQNPAHSQLLMHIGPHFMPKDRDLELIAHALCKTRPDRAFATACLASPRERVKIAQMVLDTVLMNDTKLACSLVETLLDSDQPAFYSQCINFFALSLARHNMLELAVMYALDIKNSLYYPELSNNLAIEIAKRGSDGKAQAQVTTLINNLLDFSQQETVLETYLESYLAFGDPEATSKMRFERCSTFIRGFSQKLQTSGTSSLIYVALKSCLIMMTYDETEKKALPTYIKLFDTIKDPLERQDLLERICKVILKDTDSMVGQTRIEVLVEAIKDISAKQYLWKQLAIFLENQDQETQALEVANRIADDTMRVQTLRLLTSPSKPATPLLRSKVTPAKEGTIKGVLKFLARTFFGKS